MNMNGPKSKQSQVLRREGTKSGQLPHEQLLWIDAMVLFHSFIYFLEEFPCQSSIKRQQTKFISRYKKIYVKLNWCFTCH